MSTTVEEATDTARRVVLGLALAGCAVVWVGYLSALGWRNFSSHSDSANAVLAGRDLIGGNLLLRDWNLPQASYWTMDLPVYGVLALIVGVGPTVVHLGPAIIGAALTLVGAAAARAGHRGAAGWAGAAATVVLLGLPHDFLTSFLYQGPWHVGTPLWCLAALLLLYRPGRGRLAGGVVLLTAAVVGDALAVALGVVPLVAAGLFRALQERQWRAARIPVGAGAAAMAGALLTRVALDRAGGFRSVSQPLVPLDEWPANLRLMPDLLARLLGASEAGGLSGAYRAAHFAGATLVVTAFALTGLVVIRRLVRHRPTGEAPGTRFDLDLVLFLGVAGGIATTVAVTAPDSGIAGARYLPGPLAYAAVLAGRRLADAVPHLPRRAKPLALSLAACVVLGYFAASASGLRKPQAVEPEGDLAAWLEGQGLVDGYGDYWTASDLVLNSEGAVTVRPVIPAGGKLHGQWYYAKRTWFENSRPGAQPRFVVYDRERRYFGVGPEVIRATFGEPRELRSYAAYDVFVYDHDLRPQLGGLARP